MKGPPQALAVERETAVRPDKPRRRWLPQFSIRSILVMILFASVFSGWWVDRQSLLKRIDLYENPPRAIPSWSVEQVLGAPDTHAYGDIGTAWASQTQDSQDEWLELKYGVKLTPQQIVIHETYNPGAVYMVTGFDDNGVERLLWRGKDPKPPGSGKGFSRIRPKYRLRTDRIRVYLASTKVAGWNEIDAVGVKDRFGKTFWAEEAKASSSYGNSRNIMIITPLPGVLPPGTTTTNRPRG